MMRLRNVIYAAVIGVLVTATLVRAADLRAEMEASNAGWLAAYNTQTGAAFPGFYTKDAVLLEEKTRFAL
jgi:hypothetical protein